MDPVTPTTILTPLQKAQARMQEMRASGELVIERLDPVEKARRNPNSKAMAIRAACWQCMGAGADPGTKASIRDCKVVLCALHPHRPWQHVSGRSAEQMTEEEFEVAAQQLEDPEEEEEDGGDAE